LEILTLECNELEILPISLFQLPKLRQLFLNSNNIRIIPREIQFMKSLQILKIFDNPVVISLLIKKETSTLPSEICRILFPNRKFIYFN
jgi:Leucine-rich repeat (LRR) protein